MSTTTVQPSKREELASRLLEISEEIDVEFFDYAALGSRIDVLCDEIKKDCQEAGENVNESSLFHDAVSIYYLINCIGWGFEP